MTNSFDVFDIQFTWDFIVIMSKIFVLFFHHFPKSDWLLVFLLCCSRLTSLSGKPTVGSKWCQTLSILIDTQAKLGPGKLTLPFSA